jgi:hypothetical protein
LSRVRILAAASVFAGGIVAIPGQGGNLLARSLLATEQVSLLIK